MKVFIVDDEFLQRQLVKKTVNWEQLGLEIAGEAEDGEEALEKILEEKPDILIMDINIPYINGIQVSERVKQVLPDTQVIILTAYGEFEYAKQALSLGAVSFVLKPVNPGELTEELIKCKEKLEKIHSQKSSFQKMQEEINQKQREQYLLERLSGIGGMEKEENIRQALGIRTPVCYVVLLLRFKDKEGKEKQLEEIGDIKTAVSEAVTNAIVHAYPDDLGKVLLKVRICPGNVLEITVRDHGRGIPDVEKARQPMFTTGGAERSGMGFTIMESFMDQLSVRSAAGKGTTVVMKKRLASRVKAAK